LFRSADRRGAGPIRGAVLRHRSSAFAMRRERDRSTAFFQRQVLPPKSSVD
jgi:hypothetical protein